MDYEHNLLYAGAYGDLNMIKILLENPDPDLLININNILDEIFVRYNNTKNNNTKNNNYCDILELLVKDKRSNNIVNKRYLSILVIAVEYDNTEIIKLVLEKYDDITSFINILFSDAVRCNSINTIKLLLQDKRVNYEYIDLLLAVINSSYETVELLLKDNSVNPSLDENYIYKTALINERNDICELLLTDNRVSILL